MKTAQVGLIGLGVMGANLARNIAGNNFPVVVYNRTTEKTTRFIKKFGSENLFGEKRLEDFIKSISRPRKIIILVQSGDPVDKVIESLTPLLDKGDIIIDCGNSNYRDTQRRGTYLAEQELNFVGCGISGGEEGALEGPSIMPGGSKESWEALQRIFKTISAKDFDGGPCVTHIGENGAGHYVKMVHNGIEYAIMQLIADAYEGFRSIYKLDASAISDIFAKFQRGKLNSYLLEISIKVLNQKDELMQGYLIDYILDKAGQKGTGKWTAIDAMDRGVSLPTITSAVFARYTSSQKKSREQISQFYREPGHTKDITLDKFASQLESALYAAMLIAYAEGYSLIQQAAKDESWNINLAELARIWEGGCIIRAQILKTIHSSYSKCQTDTHLLEIPEVISELKESIPNLRSTVGFLTAQGTHLFALPAALSYFEGITRKENSANLIQGLRDYFGAHTYERKDREGTYHTNWE